MAEPEPSFAGLLRRMRAEARLTQEEMAEAAGLPVRTLSDLERGINRTAHKDTALRLAGALDLDGHVGALFVAVARGKAAAAELLAARSGVVTASSAAAVIRGLPRDIVAFTGRRAELTQLMNAIDAFAAGGAVVGIHAIGGMAGIGKTTFAVHVAHRLTGDFPDGQYFLPLHAHTPGQRPVAPVDALASVLLTAGVPAAQIPPGLEARTARWRDHVAGKKILLVLDDAAGHDQVRPLLPGSSGSLVLITSRRRLAALEDAVVLSLDPLPPGEAATLLARLVGRPEMSAADAAVQEITRLCGCLPLAIGMLASQLRHHPARTAAGLAADLAAARDRLAVMQAENVSVAAAFGMSYTDLSPDQQRLFRRLGLIPGPSFDAYAAAALAGTGFDQAQRHLDELYDQHLVTEPAPSRYQLHDLLREHARALAAADNSAETDAAAGRLLDYYLHAALVAGRHFGTPPSTDRQPPPGDPPAQAPDLTTLGQAAAWLEAERANLHAAADHATTGGRFRHAIAIPAAMSGFLAARGHWDQSSVLHQIALAAARRTGDRVGEAGALSELGSMQCQTGDYPAATASLQRAVALFHDLGDRPGEAHALNQLGFVRVLTGEYPAAAASYQQALVLARNAGDRHGQAWTLTGQGLLQQLTGDYPAAAASLQQSLALSGDAGDRHGQAQALNALGVVQQETGDYPAAAESQQQALALFRDLGELLGQAYALNDLGLVRQETGDYGAAAASHQQALELFGDLGNLLGQAEALNRLGELAARTTRSEQAREYHSQALKIACGIGAAPEEARALEGLGQAHLRDGNTDEGAACLEQALAIHQRIGTPGTQRLQEMLHHRHTGPASDPRPGSARPRRPQTAHARYADRQ